MSHESPWDWLNFRYPNDDIGRFTLILDGVEGAARRLRSDNVADLRLALVITGYLTDVLLARRVARVIALSEQGFVWKSREQFDSKARGLLRQGFNRRLTLAARPYGAAFAFGLAIRSSNPPTLRCFGWVTPTATSSTTRTATLRRSAPSPWRRSMRLHAGGTKSLPANTASTWGAEGPLMRRLERVGYVSRVRGRRALPQPPLDRSRGPGAGAGLL